MGLFTTHKAVFYDDNGEQIGKKRFNPNRDNFNYNGKSFIIDLKNTSYTYRWGFIWNKREFHYYINSPNGYKFGEDKAHIKFNSEDFNTQLESKIARDLNKVGERKITDLLTTRNIIIIGVIIAVGYYLLRGGKIV